MDSKELAAAQKLLLDGNEIAAVLIENMTEAAAREGREPHPNDLAVGLGPLLSAAWQMAKRALPGDEAEARRLYVEFLRRHADGVERLG